MPTLSIVVPVYNEEKTIAQILDRVMAVDLVGGVARQLVAVDDCSQDDSFRALKRYQEAHPGLDLVVLRHDLNQGKGAALHTGIAAATGDYVIVQDADMEYDPADINRLLEPMLEGKADVVYGSRFLDKTVSHSRFFAHRLGNRTLTAWSNWFTGLRLTDMETCYKLFHAEMIKGFPLKEKRFGFEPEVTARVAKVKGVRVLEVPISYQGRTYEEGKKIGVKDALRTLYCVVKYRFARNS